MNRKTIRTAKDVEKLIWDKILGEFFQVKSLKEIELLFNNLFTSQERETVSRRLAVLSLIKQGLSYRAISQKLWVAPATISTIKKSVLASRGYKSRNEFNQEKDTKKAVSGEKIETNSIFSEWLDDIAFFIATLPEKSGPRWRFLTMNRTMPKKYWYRKTEGNK